MRRGDVWTVAGGKDYAGNARPVVIVQDDSFDGTESVTICAFTTDDTDAPLFRLAVEPNERNGLRSPSHLMVDKVTTVPKSRLGTHIGRLDDEDILRLNQAVLVFLGLAASPRIKEPRDRPNIATEEFALGKETSADSSRRNPAGRISRSV
jgi:mRNA interferase MazF